MNKERKIATLSFIILSGFTMAVFYHYVMGVYFGYGYPLNTFLYAPGDRWMDFVWPYNISANPYIVSRSDFQNLPFLYKAASIFKFIPARIATYIFLLMFVISFLCINCIQLKSGKTLSLKNLIIFTFLTYPFLFAFDRANFEIVCFLCLYLYIFFYKKSPSVSAIFLGFSIALKGFPVILAVLLLADRKYKELAIAAIVSLVATFFSYATLPGGVIENINLQMRNLHLYTHSYVIGNWGMYFGNSLFGAFKFTSMLTGLQMISSLNYTLLIVIGLIVIGIYIVLIEKNFWKRTALLVCALNLFPQVSGDYKLLHIFLPLFLFINNNESESKWANWLYLILFGLLLIPKDYYHLPNLPEASISIVLNPMLMLLLIISIMIPGLVHFFRYRSCQIPGKENGEI